MKAKKFLIIGLSLVLALSLVGCNKDVDDENVNNSGEISGDEVISSGDVSDDTNLPLEDESGDGDNVTNIINALANNATIIVNSPYCNVISAETASSYVGLSEEEFNENVADGAFYESMISPATESYCLLKLNDSADMATVKQSVFENANPRKWICSNADRVVVIDSGRYLLLAMGANESVDSMVEQFKGYFNNDVGEMLDRAFEEGELPPDTVPDGNGGFAIPMPE